MTTNFKKLTMAGALAGGLLASTAEPTIAQSAAKTPNLTGTWTMSLIGDHVIPIGLALQQDGSILSGTLTLMGKDVPVKGDLKDNAVTLTGAALMMMRGHGEGADGSGTAASVPQMKLTAVVLEDGTLSGELAGPRGPMKWTADRLKERAAAKPTATAEPAGSIGGSWNVSVIADHVTPVGLAIEQDGARLKATLTIMGGDVPLSGEYTNGAMTLSGDFTDDVRSRTGMSGALKLTAKMKYDGTIAGEFAMVRGTFPLTGERMKDRAQKTPTVR